MMNKNKRFKQSKVLQNHFDDVHQIKRENDLEQFYKLLTRTEINIHKLINHETIKNQVSRSRVQR